MTGSVKPKRRYDSTRRREQAAATRREILDAAQRLFEGQGYGATTMAAIASEAGVAGKTVYLAFETKGGVLRAVWNLLLRGDEDDAPVAQRTWYLAVLEEQDPVRKLELTARNSRVVKERIGGVLKVIGEGAAADADVAALWARIGSEFRDNQLGIVRTLATAGALREGLEEDAAADILWTLNHPDVWQLLVGERGWTPDRWEAWFVESSCALLLPSHGRRV